VAVIKLADFRGMELVSDLFVARPAALPAVFRGWLPPLPRAELRHLHNPFTHEPMFRDTGEPWLIETREPEGPWPHEIRCPNLEAFRRVSLRPVRHSDLVMLGRVLPNAVTEDFVGALFAPSSYAWFLWAVPQSMCCSLASLTSLEHVAHGWLATLRSTEDFDAEEYAGVDDWDALLGSIVKIARCAISEDKRLFLYDGPTSPR